MPRFANTFGRPRFARRGGRRVLRSGLSGGLALLCWVFWTLSVLAPNLQAQGSRKDDIVLNRFGQPVAGATVTVCLSGATGTPCAPLAVIYANVALTTAKTNPFTTDGQGNYNFYAAPGRYMIQISGAGLTTTTIPDVILPADPATPSYSSISVTNGISAFSLTLGGNLNVSGNVTLSNISAPQTGSGNPVQIGPGWYPGTASGTCTAPSTAPIVALEGATGGSIGTTTYYYKVTYFNRNGETTASPSQSFAPPSGTTNRVLIQANDQNYRTGCYGYRVYASSDNVTFYKQTAWTLPVASFSTITRSGNIVTAVTSAAHGFIPGEQIVVASVTGGATSFNGTFTLIGQQMSTPTTLFWQQTGGNESGNAGTGTGTVIAGLGSDSQGHFAPGDFILSAITLSGANPPATNGATIDPLQVALNATATYSGANSVQVNGQLVVPQGQTTLTTPLIVSNIQKVLGASTGGPVATPSTSVSVINSNWTDNNLGTVMVLGPSNGVHIEGVEIEATGNALVLAAWGPGFANQQHVYRNNRIRTTDTTGVYSAVRVQAGTFYNMHFENNYYRAGLAAFHLVAHSGSFWFVSGLRWDLTKNAVLSSSSVTDPDRAALRASFPNGLAAFYVMNLFTESATGIEFDAVNLGLHLKHVQTADPNPPTGTPAIVRIGSDANGGGNMGDGVVLEDDYFQPNANYGAMIQYAGNFGNNIQQLTLRNVTGGQTNAIDANNVSISTYVEDSSVFPYEGATTNKIINQVASGAPITVVGTLYDGTVNTRYAMHSFRGGTRFGPAAFGSTLRQYLIWSEAGGNTLEWWGGDPATATNKMMQQGFNSGGFWTFLKNDGATTLFQINPSAGANTITVNGAVSGANTSGSGGVVALTTSPALVTPSIGGETVSASPRSVYSAFLPGVLTSTWTGATLTLDKAITVTRVQAQAKTPPSGCGTNAVVQLTDGTTPINLTVAAAANDSGAITQNYSAAAALTIKVSTAAATCTTNPQDVNVIVQFRTQ